MDPRYKDHKQALAMWEKMAPKFDRQGRNFPSMLLLHHLID